MTMLIIQTFVLMVLSAVLGLALGRLLGEAYGGDTATDRPWLRDLRARPATPLLPGAPTLLSDAERARLSAVDLAPSPRIEAVQPLASIVESVPAPASAPAPAPESVSAPDPASAPAPFAEAPTLTPEEAAKAAEADAHGSRPAPLLAARVGGPDDLKRIKGIGKQNEARLHALGVWHFDQIAAWTPENVTWVGSFLAFAGRIEREDWVGQATVLAAGGTTDFAARVDAGEVPTSSG